ncbi:hypothetical protein ACHAWF_018697 [Thalassiosira exigua]
MAATATAEDEGDLTDDERREAAERRRAELELVESAYSPDEVRVELERGDGECDGGGSCCRCRRATIVRRLRLPRGNGGGDDVGAGGGSERSDASAAAAAVVELRLRPPPGYPVAERAALIVDGSLASCPSNPPDVRRAALAGVARLVDACRKSAAEVVEDGGGGEAAWTVLARADEWVGAEWEEEREEHARARRGASRGSSSTRDGADPATDEIDGATLGRRIVYSHHIIAAFKRRGLADLASQHRLGGYAKIGWPGIILFEGDESGCRADLSVRADEREEVPPGDALDARRRLPPAFEELGKDELSLLARKCQEAGLEDMFLACMKIDAKRTIEDEPGAEAAGVEGAGNPHGVHVLVDHMNDETRYRRWLRKTCQTQGCPSFVRRCRFGADASRAKPAIYVGVFGDRDGVKRTMKQWRTSRVDVDARNKPCLERMMTVVEEGDVRRTSTAGGASSSNDEGRLDCSFEELERLEAAWDGASASAYTGEATRRRSRESR